MIRYQQGFDYLEPVFTDNRRFRQDIPEVQKHFEEAEREMEQFPREDGVIKSSEIVDFVDCPVCGSPHSDQLFLKYGLIYVECPLCTQVFVKNRLKDSILLKLYETSVVDQLDRQVQQSPQHHEYYSRIYAKYLSYVDGFGIGNRHLLDVGCGAGEFLKFCADNTDLKLHALDFYEDSVDRVERLTGRGNYYYKQRLEDVAFGDRRFGLITLWGVLEHVPNPLDVLRKCSSILDDEGCIVILIPNIHSRAADVLGINTPTLNPRAHLNFYTEKSLQYLCRQTGLRMDACFQELPVIDLMYEHVVFDKALWDGIVRRKEGYYHVYVLRRAPDNGSLGANKPIGE
jgi:2-polyprenyl-3-methyl-5-hydroxy-6-metoxy-1,4-benzoquinol methylase